MPYSTIHKENLKISAIFTETSYLRGLTFKIQCSVTKRTLEVDSSHAEVPNGKFSNNL